MVIQLEFLGKDKPASISIWWIYTAKFNWIGFVHLFFFFFFSNTRAAYHCIKTKKKLVQCSVTTQIKRTPDGHKPASQLNTTRKINSNMNYSHPTQHKRLALNIALSQRSIPRRESSCSCSSTSEICHATRPCGATEVLCERVSPPLALPKLPSAEARRSHRVDASEATPLALLA